MTDPQWARIVRAVHCFALTPAALGGLHIRGRAGPARDRVTALIHDLCPQPQIRLHPEMGDDVLFGGLDLTETLRLGRTIRRTGLLAQSGVFVLPMAERASTGLAARLAQSLDAGDHGLIAFDEGVDPDETVPTALGARLGVFLDLDGLRVSDLRPLSPLADVTPVADPLADLVDLAARLGIPGLHLPLLALRVARASAHVDDRATIGTDDLCFAVEVCLAPRATSLPEVAQPMDDPAPPEPTPDQHDGPGDADQTALPDGDILLEAALAMLPPDLLDRIAQGDAPRANGAGQGARQTGNRRGRPMPPRQKRPDGRSRIDVIATLRSAAPWQKLRGRVPGGPVQIRGSDIRLKRYETRSDRLLIFAVDASGSAAFARLAEAKGAVELLLADAYARRDHVALVSFRGSDAEVLLPPTRSLVRTKRQLASLPGGGGTPLAAGLRTSLTVAHQARGRGMAPAIVVLTDGRPNIALSGKASRPDAADDARTLSRALRADGLPGLVIDTGNRPTPDLANLAAEMGVPCIPMPRADSQGLSRAVMQAL